MQSYPYVTYPYATGATVPINYMTPAHYQQNQPLYVNQSYNHYGRIPATVPYVSQQAPYHLPPISNRMPMMLQPQQQQQPYIQHFQYPQMNYYNPNGFNGVRPVAPVKNAPKKAVIDLKDNPSDSKANRAINRRTSNKDMNDLSKNKGTQVRVSRIRRRSKRNNDFQDDSSDDEFERIPLGSPRPERLKLPLAPSKRLAAQNQRRSLTMSSCSHCSTCTNCSCSECRHQNGRHFYDDCPQCRAELEREKAQTKRQKPK